MEHPQEEEVILILADISGYTRFLVSNRQAIRHAQVIITELTKAIIAQVEIPLEISKLEGDAVFLSALKANSGEWQQISEEIGKKLLIFLAAFSDKLVELTQSNTCSCDACMNIDKLHLKIIVHSGQALLYHLGRFEELSGVDVIIAHRLLKNSVEPHEYILMTEAAYREVQFPTDLPVSSGEETYGDIGTIRTYIYFPSADSEAGAPAPTVAYTWKYHRLKNMAIKGMKSLLIGSGLAKLPKFNHLPGHDGEALPGD